MSVPVAILAGGLATRLGSLSHTTPKSLVDVAGQPFICHQLAQLRSAGFTDIVLLVGHLGTLIRERLGDGSRFGVRLRYVSDGAEPRGTGGAIANALPELGEQFLMLYGDSYLECDYNAVLRAFVECGRRGLMTVCRNDGRWDRSNVLFRDGRIVTYDKTTPSADMQHIDYGLGAFRASAFSNRAGRFDLADVYRDLLAAGELEGFSVPGRFYEIGTPAGIEDTEVYLASKRLRVVPYSSRHLEETIRIASTLSVEAIERMADLLAALRARGGRLFFLGVGGSAAHCSHAVNDFRKIAGIEAYTPVDNVSELTARTNDEGWDQVFAAWLRGSRLSGNDMVFVLSVGGGSLERNISPNLVVALRYAKSVGAQVLGIVGRDGGYTAQVADACVIVPTVNPDNVTPHTEAFHAVVWHLLVSHPAVKRAETKWESQTVLDAPSSWIATA